MKKAKQNKHKNNKVPTRIHECIAVYTFCYNKNKVTLLSSKTLGFYLHTVRRTT